MKLFKLYLFIISIGLVFNSCKDLTELNDDTKNPKIVTSGSLFSSAEKNLVNRMVSTNVNNNTFRLWAQQWANTQYPDASNFDLVTRNVNGRLWDELLVDVIGNLREAKAVNDTEVLDITPEQNKTQDAIFDVLEVYSWHILVDVFGAIPYDDAFSENLTPTYDDGVHVYDAIITILDQAISNIGDDSGLGSSDFVYSGNTDSWKQFANSLKLRLAIRIADVNSAKAATMAKEAIDGGVIVSNSFNFNLNYDGGPPNTNPLWEDLVQSKRTDYIAANTLVDHMNTLEDPRRAAFFDSNIEGEYIGGIAGGGNSYPDFSHVSPTLKDPTFPGTLINAAEVHFLMADAVERGFDVTGTAEDHYNLGIQRSFEEWGLPTSMADDYIANVKVAYDTAPGTWKEKIGMQKYLALYNRGFEAWTTYRLYDAPEMNIAESAGITPPSRWTFPNNEYSLNEANVKAAAAKFGGDFNTGKVFWDVN